MVMTLQSNLEFIPKMTLTISSDKFVYFYISKNRLLDSMRFSH